MVDLEYVYASKKVIATQNKIGYILKDMITNKEFFKTTKINILFRHYGICKKTLKKYLGNYFRRLKGTKEKRIYFPDKTTFLFIRDLDKIVLKYNGLIDNDVIRQGQYYLNNLKK